MRIVSLTLLLMICGFSLFSQKIRTSLRQSWHTNEWQDSLLDTYTYDSRGLLTTKTEQQWSITTSGWINKTKETHIYNADSTEQQQITQLWDATGNVWLNYKLLTITRLPYGGASMLYQDWVNGSWQNEIQVATINDKNGTLSKSLKQKWNATAGVWINDVKADYTMHRNGKIDHYVCQMWDTAAHSWSKRRKDQCRFLYDKDWRPIGNMDDRVIHSRVVHTAKNTISYDGQGHKTSNSFTSWDAASHSWLELLHEDYINNSEGVLSSYVCLQYRRTGGEPYSKVKTMYNYF